MVIILVTYVSSLSGYIRKLCKFFKHQHSCFVLLLMLLSKPNGLFSFSISNFRLGFPVTDTPEEQLYTVLWWESCSFHLEQSPGDPPRYRGEDGEPIYTYDARTSSAHSSSPAHWSEAPPRGFGSRARLVTGSNPAFLLVTQVHTDDVGRCVPLSSQVIPSLTPGIAAVSTSAPRRHATPWCNYRS